MSQTLVPGQNAVVPDAVLILRVKAGNAADFSSFRLYADGKTRQDPDFVFYGQTANDDNTISFAHDETSGVFTINLPALKPDVTRVAFAATSNFPKISGVGNLEFSISSGNDSLLQCNVQTSSRDEAAIILGEFYRHKGQWKFRFVDQGFNGGLKPLAEFYGVEITADQATPPSEPARVNLSKVVLTKNTPSIDLRKKDIGTGDIKINLNWNVGTAKSSGIGKFLPWGNKGIDLDLAAYVKMRNGEKTIIQALGETFGSMDSPPYVKLLGDDRTGAAMSGEWIHVNGAKLSEIAEILIFTFIYSGTPSWANTDASVRIQIPGQPEVETRLTEGNDKYPMCAIARIINDGGNIRIERLDRYFGSHPDMDRAFGWGFRWKSGSK